MPEQSLFSGSVGYGGINRTADVLLVQKLLNAVPYRKGGPMPLLERDGICGPKTAGAIKRFQSVNLGWGDGRIDPGFGTEQALIALLILIGLLKKLLEDKPATSKPTSPPSPPPLPPISGDHTPIRQRFMAICKELLPPPGTLTKGSAPTGPKATACGEFPGRVFRRVPVLLPGQPGAFRVKVTTPGFSGYLYLTSPTIGWEQLSQAVDKKYPPAKTWKPFVAGTRPRPGDIYVLGQFKKKQDFQHVGIIVDARGSEWTTADGGQGNGWQSGFVKRKFHESGQIDGEAGNQAWLRGWVDLDLLTAVAVAAFPANLVGAG